MEAKFNYGDKVLINGNIVGIVLFSYNMFSLPHDPCFVYRIIVDAHELCHRVLVDTQQLAVMEVSERELTLFEY